LREIKEFRVRWLLGTGGRSSLVFDGKNIDDWKEATTAILELPRLTND
jgi:hypothetical protein